MGLKRNLRPSEILNQVLLVQRFLQEKNGDETDPEKQYKVRNLVFMGMGEPLHNYEHLRRSLDLLVHPKAFGFSKRRITVSTSGLLPEMKKLLEETGVRLAVSINATEQKTRKEIMPISRKYPLRDLLEACRNLPLPRRERITFEYVLLADVNDRDEDARRLVSLLHGIPCKLNLLCFNEFPGAPFRRPSDRQAQHFRDLLHGKGLQVNLRISRGRSVLAACGQLRSQMSASA
jgi:23S rRNA (adenine2503-C2)-methyltransferase